MSGELQQPLVYEQTSPAQPQHQPSEAKSLTSSLNDRLRKIKQFQLRPMIEDIVTFISIIFAYQYVSLSYDNEKKIERWLGIEFGDKKTGAVLLLIFAVYLIILHVLHLLVYSYETTPASKPVPQNWEEMEQQQPRQPSTITVNQVVLSADSFSVLISHLKNYSVYGFVFVFFTTSYAYICGFNKRHKLINLEQVSFLVFWFVTATLFYAGGKLLGKLIGIRTLHHFGLMVVLFVLFIQIAAAHGFNIFIFL